MCATVAGGLLRSASRAVKPAPSCRSRAALISVPLARDLLLDLPAIARPGRLRSARRARRLALISAEILADTLPIACSNSSALFALSTIFFSRSSAPTRPPDDGAMPVFAAVNGARSAHGDADNRGVKR